VLVSIQTSFLRPLTVFSVCVIAAAGALVPTAGALRAGDRPTFFVGGRGTDDDGRPLPVEAAPGERVEIAFYYQSPTEHVPGTPRLDQVQGLSMVVCHDCRLRCDEASFRVGEDTIVAALDADFVAFQSDGDPDDGDGCQMVLALLVEFDGPFVGKTLPPTDGPQPLASVEVQLSEELACGDEPALELCDDVEVVGVVPLANIVSVGSHSYDVEKVDGQVLVREDLEFLRGDCDADDRINITDAITVLMAAVWPAQNGTELRCEDACDADDDGRVDLSDTLTLLRYLFMDGSRPPAPGTLLPGPDPTADTLECAAVCP